MTLSRTHVLSAKQIRRFCKTNWAKLVGKIAQFGRQFRPNCFAEKDNPKANRGNSGRNFGFYHRKRVIISCFYHRKSVFGQKSNQYQFTYIVTNKRCFLGLYDKNVLKILVTI